MYILAQMWENGAPKAREIFSWPAEGESTFVYPRVYTQNARVFVENSNMSDKHDQNFDALPRPPRRPSAAGPSMCHPSLVTRGEPLCWPPVSVPPSAAGCGTNAFEGSTRQSSSILSADSSPKRGGGATRRGQSTPPV